MQSSRLSFWGWGYEEKLPGKAELERLAARVALLDGSPPPEAAPFPARSSVRLSPPRLTVPESLASFSSQDDIARAGHTWGKAYPDLVRGFRGDFSRAPDFVAFVRNEEEVSRTLEWCSKKKVAVVPFGGGTSVVAGVEGTVGPGYEGVVSLDVRAMAKVLEVDSVSRAARIEAGATGPMLEAQLGAHGFTLRHFPQSFELSTLGGWIATRAGGHFATLYTHIDDLVECLRVVTPKGVLATRRFPASGAGPSPNALLLGSEGTLGVVTEAWMRVFLRPTWREAAAVRFESFENACLAVRELSQSGLHPANCRLLDGAEALLHGVAKDGSSVLLLAFESADHPMDAWMERALRIAEGRGGVREDRRSDGSTESWKAAFFEAPYLQNALVSLGVVADTFETCCPWSRFEGLYRGVGTAMGEALVRVCGGGLLTCRFTHVYPDGPAPYFTFIGRGRRGGELEQWAELKQVAMEAVLANGGTITHHHAVGRTHRPGYDRERPPLFAEAFRAAKRALDPAGILNPGVLVDPAGDP